MPHGKKMKATKPTKSTKPLKAGPANFLKDSNKRAFAGSSTNFLQEKKKPMGNPGGAY